MLTTSVLSIQYYISFFTDKNACRPNPCRNHGNCIDQSTGYICQCVGGWKGKTCTLSKCLYTITQLVSRYLNLRLLEIANYKSYRHVVIC